MARISQTACDLTNKTGKDSDFANVIIRQYPGHEGVMPKRLDVLLKVIDTLKTADDVVVIDVKRPDGREDTIIARLADFNALTPGDMAGIVEAANGVKGRRPGTQIGG